MKTRKELIESRDVEEWDDGSLAIEIKQQQQQPSTPLPKIINTMSCLICGAPFNISESTNNKQLLAGVKLTCSCDTVWYIHYPVIIPKGM